MKCDAYHTFFQNLANPVKTQIIGELQKRPLSVKEISEKTGLEQSKISHALTNLKFCSIVESKHNGKQRIYYLNKKTILPILRILDNHRTNYCNGCSLKK